MKTRRTAVQGSGLSGRKVSRIMKNYMKTMMETYFVKNLVVFSRVSDEDVPAEMLKRNSYALLNVSPRFF
jgi:hypothetical protein